MCVNESMPKLFSAIAPNHSLYSYNQLIHAHHRSGGDCLAHHTSHGFAHEAHFAHHTHAFAHHSKLASKLAHHACVHAPAVQHAAHVPACHHVAFHGAWRPHGWRHDRCDGRALWVCLDKEGPEVFDGAARWVLLAALARFATPCCPQHPVILSPPLQSLHSLNQLLVFRSTNRNEVFGASGKDLRTCANPFALLAWHTLHSTLAIVNETPQAAHLAVHRAGDGGPIAAIACAFALKARGTAHPASTVICHALKVSLLAVHRACLEGAASSTTFALLPWRTPHATISIVHQTLDASLFPMH
mmetsp:Transcript_151505/g.267354  ORF Transcript_151505/g.267354 Transcript_151505/m.267354 type:complete len:301 (+) Transcript_151505:1045-1947(+)